MTSPFHPDEIFVLFFFQFFTSFYERHHSALFEGEHKLYAFYLGSKGFFLFWSHDLSNKAVI